MHHLYILSAWGLITKLVPLSRIITCSNLDSTWHRSFQFYDCITRFIKARLHSTSPECQFEKRDTVVENSQKFMPFSLDGTPGRASNNPSALKLPFTLHNYCAIHQEVVFPSNELLTHLTKLSICWISKWYIDRITLSKLDEIK